MPSLTDAFGPWHEFYALLGTASATLVGLLFVAASVGAGVFSDDRPAPMRVFLTASVVNFSILLATCLIVLAPVRVWLWFGGMIAACGVFGLGHSCLAWRDTLRDGLFARIDAEDRIWYIVLPIVGYLFLVGSGVALASGQAAGRVALALSIGMLLAVGIHNAWDITVWSMTRRQQ